MSVLKISPASDDLVSYLWEGDGDEIGTPEMKFIVTLPDGTELPIEVEYIGPWEFRIDLPEGTTVECVPPDDDD